MENPYAPPIEALLRHSGISPTAGDDTPPNYRKELGLTVADIPELARLAADTRFDAYPNDAPELWAPVRAGQALAQFAPEAPEAMAGIIALLDQGDRWYAEDILQFIDPVGPPAFEPLLEYLRDETKTTDARMSVQCCLRELAKAHPELRDRHRQELATMLENYAQHPPLINAVAIWDLVKDYRDTALEKVHLIEAAYKANRIDLNMAGPWASVQVELGLKSASDFKPEDLKVPLHVRPEYLQNLATRDPMDVLKSAAKASKTPEGIGFGIAAPAKKTKKKKKKK